MAQRDVTFRPEPASHTAHGRGLAAVCISVVGFRERLPFCVRSFPFFRFSFSLFREPHKNQESSSLHKSVEYKRYSHVHAVRERHAPRWALRAGCSGVVQMTVNTLDDPTADTRMTG